VYWGYDRQLYDGRLDAGIAAEYNVRSSMPFTCNEAVTDAVAVVLYTVIAGDSDKLFNNELRREGVRALYAAQQQHSVKQAAKVLRLQDITRVRDLTSHAKTFTEHTHVFAYSLRKSYARQI